MENLFDKVSDGELKRYYEQFTSGFRTDRKEWLKGVVTKRQLEEFTVGYSYSME